MIAALVADFLFLRPTMMFPCKLGGQLTAQYRG
jgi:hypothetical protein